MDTDTNTVLDAGAATEKKEDTDSFTKVKSKKTQKRKREHDGGDMDTEPTASKRPQFPPISGDKLKVITIWEHGLLLYVSILSVTTPNKLFCVIWLSLKVTAKY